MSVTTEKVKKALNLDDSDDTTLLPAYLTAAENYIKGAVGEDELGEFYAREDVSSLYDVAVIALAGSYFTYRIALADTNNYPIDLTLNSIIGQLRGIYASFLEEKEGGDV